MSKPIPRVLLYALAAFSWINPLQAQSALRLDLPPQPLAVSLRTVATQAGVNVPFDPPLVEGRQARAIKGEFTTEQAFTEILQGSGLKFRHHIERQT